MVDDGLSRNGTYVNGERVNGRRRLRDGDRIVFGETPVTFRSPADAEADSTAAIARRRVGHAAQREASARCSSRSAAR